MKYRLVPKIIVRNSEDLSMWTHWDTGILGCRCSLFDSDSPSPNSLKRFPILMINDAKQRRRQRNFNITTLCLGYKSLLHIKCSQWVVNQQPESEGFWKGFSGSGFGFGFKVFSPLFLDFWLRGCTAFELLNWTASVCKSIENNLLLLIISERSCALRACPWFSGEEVEEVELEIPESVGLRLGNSAGNLENLPGLVIDHVSCPRRLPLAIRVVCVRERHK